jgi:hypothetical protein
MADAPAIGACSQWRVYDIREMWEVHHAIVHY